MNSPITEPAQDLADSSQAGTSASRPKMSLVNTKLINWSSFLFAVLQSVCSAFIALSGVRLLIGIGAFAAASRVLKLADRMHIDAIRIPMMLLALAGSVLNLVVLWRVWSLRRRPASAWRQQPVSKRKKASELFQFTLSVLTLILLAAEFVAHHILFANR
jgi:heme O synthase-like polyprenyltransferase